MTIIGTVYLNGCNFQVGFDLLGTDNQNKIHYIRLYGILNVTNNYIAWSRGTATVWDATAGLATRYNQGQYIVVSKDLSVVNETSINVTGILSTTFVSGQTTGTVNLPAFKNPSVIHTFTGNNITENFNATFTKSSSAYEDRLRISIPNVKTLETYRNYTSGQNVTLSSSSIEYIKNYSNNTVTLGGVIETWQGGTKIGESAEIKIQCSISKGNKLRINGQWKDAIPYIRVNGQWKEATPYVRVNGVWKEEI